MGLTERANATEHKELCAECGGGCCERYYGEVEDSIGIIARAKKNKRFYDQLFKHFTKAVMRANRLKKKDAERRADSILNSFNPTIMFHLDLLKLDNIYNNGRCLFYEQRCVVYEARPEKCNTHVCGALENLVNKTS